MKILRGGGRLQRWLKLFVDHRAQFLGTLPTLILTWNLEAKNYFTRKMERQRMRESIAAMPDAR